MIKKDRVNKAPGVVGVYLFTQKGKVLYVGKAINIKARVISHIENAKNDRKEYLIIKNSDSLRWIETDSEFKALLLEAKLIRTHHPKYNVRWRDDKNHLYIKIPIKDEYPKIQLARKEDDKKSLFFGPFPSVKSTEEILSEIRRVFPFCAQRRISKQPCFYFKIGLCNPCPSTIEKIENTELKSELKKQYKRNIRQIIKILDGKTEEVLKDLSRSLNQAKKRGDYEQGIILRNRINRFTLLITQARLAKEVPEAYNLSQERIGALKQILKKYIGGDQKLGRIECYDISNFAQKEATASMVVFTNGTPDRSQYRKFKIKRLDSKSDFEMLDEVIRRRFKNNWKAPDLIVVDGGKPQVRTVLRTLIRADKIVKTIGIAKNPDRLIVGQDYLPTLRPARNNPGFNLIQHIRDESHRFAKKYHLQLRNKRLLV